VVALSQPYVPRSPRAWRAYADSEKPYFITKIGRGLQRAIDL